MPKLSDFSLILIFVALSIGSLFFLPKLTLRLNPSAELPELNLQFSYPGATPEAVNQMVIAQLEPAVNSLQGINKLESYAYNGYGYIKIKLDRKADLDFFRFELAAIVRQIYPKLPKTVRYPQLTAQQADQEANPVLMSYSLSGDKSASEISDYAQQQILPLLSAIEGIRNIEIIGARASLIKISYKPEILQRYGLTTDLIRTQISKMFRTIELGKTREKNGHEEQYCRLITDKTNTNLWNLPLINKYNQIIRLGQVVSLKKTEIKAQHFFRINGKNTVNLIITAYNYVNSLVLAQKIKTKIIKIQSSLPSGFHIFSQYDSTKNIRKELNKIYHRTAFTILLLLLFVFLIRLEWRYLLIILLSLISNISLAFVLYYLFNVEIQLYSLAGITISLGFAIDNSLIIFEHIRNQGNKKIFVAILASTLTTIGALSGIYFLQDKIRLQLIDFASVIIINLVISLFVAYFYVPALVRKLYKNKILKKHRKAYFIFIHHLNKIYNLLIRRQIRRPWITILFFVLLFGLPVFKLPNYISGENWYTELYNNTIGSDFYNNNLRIYVNKTLGGTLRLFTYYVFDNDFYGEKHEQKLNVEARAPYGTTVEQINTVFKQLENFLSRFPEIDKFITHIHSAQNAQIEILFKKKAQKSMFPYLLKNQIAAFAFDLGAIDWIIYGYGKSIYTGTGGASLPSYIVSLKGYNYQQILKEADTLSKIILQHPRVSKVERTSPFSYHAKAEVFNINFDRKKLAYYHQNIRQQALLLQSLSAERNYDFAIFRHNRYQKIKLEPKLSHHLDFWQIKNKNFGTDTHFLRIKNVAKIKRKKLMSEIYRINQEFEVYLRYDYVGSTKFGDKYLKKILKKAKKILPLGYHAQKKKDNFWFYSWEKPSKPYILILLVVAIIYFVTSVLFESFKQPLAILLLIPVSFIGVFLTFYLFDLNFDMGGFASFIVLSGLTVNSGIYLINDYNHFRQNKPEKYHIIHYLRAFRHKIQPIVLTIVSTALGMLPFIWGGQKESFWFTLAAGTIGGLIFSIVGIILALPVALIKK